MSGYLNPSSEKFMRSLRSSIYIDKSELISQMNEVIGTEQCYICVSRPRRFGKTMAINMLSAYYGCEEDTSYIFEDLKISKDTSFAEHLNKYNVIAINMQEFLSSANNVEDMISMLKQYITEDIIEKYPMAKYRDKNNFIQVMKAAYAYTKHSFIILIDEWDCIFREYRYDTQLQEKYLDFLRLWLKDQAYVGLAYMTGILPIKKYGTHSALNMFDEYSMANPKKLASYYGFTGEEVTELCREYQMNFMETKAWYDGYIFDLSSDMEKQPAEDVDSNYLSVYSPKSVVEAMRHKKYDNYWNQTETYEALKVYIQMNYDGLKEAVVKMLAGGSIKINTGTFSNDMTTFIGKDDVLTLLVHLGYLTYDSRTKTVSIPNKEVGEEYVNSIQAIGWDEVICSVKESQNLLQSLWNIDAEAVAAGIDRVHQEVSILQYNDENALSYTISLAFYCAKNYYTVIRELPTGRGFADICLIPRKLHADKPAVIIELKWDKSAKGAISQIKEKKYVGALEEYGGNLILAGINYDKTTKTHTCQIEKVFYDDKQIIL